MGSVPLPPLSCIMIAYITATYSGIPYSLAYLWIVGVCASTSALRGSALWEFPIKAAPPIILQLKSV